MQVHLTLMGALKPKTPDGGVLEMAQGSTVEDVLSRLEIEPAEVQIVMVNNKPRPDRTSAVNDGDRLTVVAPVGGG